MAHDYKRKIVRNAVANFSARIWSLLIGLFLTPYILGRIGATEYGVWILISAFVGYIGILDLGLGTSFVKYVAEYDARGDQDSLNGVFSAGLAFYTVASVVILIAFYPLVDPALAFFNIPTGLEGVARAVVILTMLSLLLANFNGVYLSIINGLQRMEISNTIMVCLSFAYVVACIAVLELGFGIVGLAALQLLTQVMSTVVAAYFAYRLCPGLRSDLRSMRTQFPALLRYSVNLHISRIASLVNFQLDKLIIGRFIDAPHVTFYEIGNRLPAMGRSFPALLLDALTPAFAELEVRRGKAELYALFSRSSKYISVLAFPLFIGVMVTGQTIIEAWVGGGYPASATVLKIVCLGYLINILAGPVSPLLQGVGRPEYQRNTEALSLLLNVTLSITLIKRYGFYGAPIGTSIAMSVAHLYYLYSFHRFMGRPLLPFLTSTFLKPGLAASIAGFLAYATTSTLLPYFSGGRVNALIVLTAAGSVFAVSYTILILRLRYLDERDRALALYTHGILVAMVGAVTTNSKALVNRVRSLWAPSSPR